MVRQLHPKTGEFDVFEAFSKAGQVVDVRLISDERSGKCQGVAYVEMADLQGATSALMLNGTILRGMPIVVQQSLAEKNRLAAAGAGSAEILRGGFGNFGSAPAEAGMKLYVGGLHFSITSEQLHALFAPFGEIDKVDLHTEGSTGQSKGYGFVHFKQAADGKKCIDQMDGFELAGRSIKVGVSQSAQVAAMPLAQQQQQMMMMQQLGALGPLGVAGLPSVGGDGQSLSQLDSLDDTADGKGELGKISAAQRASIMSKLAKNANMDVPDDTRMAANTVGGAAMSSGELRCVVLKNMFDRLSDDAQSNPNFYTTLEMDVRGEVSKVGSVLHVACDKWSNGFVYVKMFTAHDAQRLKDLMHGRYFAQNKIIAEFFPEEKYNKKFKLG